MFDAVSSVFRNYSNFSGRSRRSEYWYFWLFNVLLNGTMNFLTGFFSSSLFEIILILYGLFMMIPSFALFVRRLHDTNRSGWWWLIGLIPILGILFLFLFMCLDSDEKTNDYGPSPKYMNDINSLEEFGRESDY